MDKEIELLARKIAAKKMALVNDKDGLRLPDELWKQCIIDAKIVLFDKYMVIHEPNSEEDF